MIRKIIKLVKNNIKTIKDNNKKTNRSYINNFIRIINYKVKYKINLEDYYSLQFYNMRDNEVATFFTYKMNDKLVDKMNNKKKKKIFDDKSVFDQIFEEYLGRKCLKTDASYDEFVKFIGTKKEIFYKKIAGNRGIGAQKINVDDYKGNIKKLYDDIQNMDLGIVEDVVVPHDDIKKICDSGLSTIRLITLNINGKLVILDSVFMIINGGIVNCEVTGGGLSACIDVNSGIVVSDAVDVNRNYYSNHPISGEVIKGFQIPFWNEVLSLANEVYNKVPGVNYIGWDIAITNDGPIIIEGNASWPSHRIWQIPYLREKKGKKELVLNKLGDI